MGSRQCTARQRKAKRRPLGDRRLVHEALTYPENHGERMHYAQARARGQPIDNGNVKATCKSLVALRMERPGLDGRMRLTNTSWT